MTEDLDTLGALTDVAINNLADAVAAFVPGVLNIAASVKADPSLLVNDLVNTMMAEATVSVIECLRKKFPGKF